MSLFLPPFDSSWPQRKPCEKESAGGWANKQTDRQRMTTTVTDWMGVGSTVRRRVNETVSQMGLSYNHRQKMRLVRGCGVVVEGGGQERVREENRLMASTFLNRA